MENPGLFSSEGNSDAINNMLQIYFKKVNRVEVIDQNGRSYVNWKLNNKTEISLQDDGRTLKVFINDLH